MSQAADHPSTLRGWYEFSKGEGVSGRRRAEYFAALAELTDSAFLAMVEAASQPAQGELRPLGSIKGQGREPVPELDQLLDEMRSPKSQRERQLQYQWCFHKSAMAAFRIQLRSAGIEISAEVTQPEAVIAAPVSYYREAQRRSRSRERQNEAAHAVRFARLLNEAVGLRVRLIVISDKWPQQRTAFRCRQCSPYRPWP